MVLWYTPAAKNMINGDTARRTQASQRRSAMNSSSDSLYSASLQRSCQVQKLELPTSRNTITLTFFAASAIPASHRGAEQSKRTVEEETSDTYTAVERN